MLEGVAAEGVVVHPDGVSLATPDTSITGRLLVDCMGNFSPIVRRAGALRGAHAVLGWIDGQRDGQMDRRTDVVLGPDA